MKNNVKKYRQAAGLTLSQLSEISGIPISTLSDIERGAEPRMITGLKIARALRAQVERLWFL